MSATSANISKIFEVFANLSYESVLDSDASIKAWIASHNDLFSPFINGSYVNISNANVFTTKNPSTGADLAKLIQSDETIIDAAVNAAKDASESWSKLNLKERGKIIYNIARNVQKHLQIFVLVETINSGRTSREVKDLDIAAAIKSLYYYAGSCSFAATNSHINNNQALGVVAIANYWDSAFLSLVNKLGAALAAGNTVIVLPHRLTPLSAFMLNDICIQSGVPKGVINLVTSNSDLIYKQLASHPLVDCISYDGTTSLAQDLVIKTSFHLPNKKLLFQLNGKSTLVIYDTADFDSAIESIVDGCFYSNGQHRFSINKVLVQENVYDDIYDRLDKRFQRLRCGSNLDKCNDYGAFINETEFNSLKNAFTSDNQLVHTKHYYQCSQDKSQKYISTPSIVTNIQINSDFYQSELNGPYVILLPFRTVKESIEILNTTRFGSAVSLWSQNISLVLEVANNVHAGTVWINSFFIERGVETRKSSGNYHISGVESLLNFMRPKWQTRFEIEKESSIEQLEKDLKAFGGLSSSSTVPIADNLANVKTYKLYIGGKQTRPDTQGSRSIYAGDDDKSKKLTCLVADSSRKDVRNAVEAANAAFNDWRKRINHNKAQILYFFGENLASRRNEFVEKLELISGKSKDLCEKEFDLSLNQIFFYASLCDKYIGTINDTVESSSLMQQSEAIGCIAIICGHTKYPLLSFIVHMMAAIAYGNSVVIVPDEKWPIPALDLYEVFETSDMPGVVNILSGNKQHLTKYLCEHQQVHSIWYMSDINKGKLSENDLSAIRFIKYTSNFNMKRNWFINSNDVFNQNDTAILESALENEYSSEIGLQSVQYKYIHIPYGVIFAN